AAARCRPSAFERALERYFTGFPHARGELALRWARATAKRGAVATRAPMRDATENWSIAIPDTSLHNCEQESTHQANTDMQVGFVGLGIMGASMAAKGTGR